MYQPSQKILEKYANVLVNFALGGGGGIKKGETVRLTAYDIAKPFYIELRRAILKAGGNVLGNYLPANERKMNLEKEFYDLADENQLKFFPDKFLKGLIDQMDHSIYIDSDTNKFARKEVAPKKIMETSQVFKPFKEWRDEKENKGKFTWTIALYATEAMAREARLSLKEYWNQIIKACFLDKPDPVKEWKSVYKKNDEYKNKLNKLKIEKMRIIGPDVDLKINMGEKRKWVGGSGRNVPSFEIFTSPDWRGLDGWARFNQPLYSYGNIIEGIELGFKNGKVVKAKAKKNEKVLLEMLKAENADKIGEFSLTDKRFSRITKFMGETLYDENMGGPDGNFHIALGSSYHDAFDGNPSGKTKEFWQRLGFNKSAIHTDVVSTSSRIVTATLKNGSEKTIYKNGQFCL